MDRGLDGGESFGGSQGAVRTKAYDGMADNGKAPVVSRGLGGSLCDRPSARCWGARA
jgi:hypothetical protein